MEYVLDLPAVVLQMVVAGTAAFRVWRLLARDSILDRPRVWLAEHAPRQFGWVNCPWCSGFWIAAACWAVLEWSTSPWLIIPVVVFAVAGVQAVLSVASEMMGD